MIALLSQKVASNRFAFLSCWGFSEQRMICWISASRSYLGLPGQMSTKLSSPAMHLFSGFYFILYFILFYFLGLCILKEWLQYIKSHNSKSFSASKLPDPIGHILSVPCSDTISKCPCKPSGGSMTSLLGNFSCQWLRPREVRALRTYLTFLYKHEKKSNLSCCRFLLASDTLNQRIPHSQIQGSQ